MDESLPPWLQPDLLPPKPAGDTYGCVERDTPNTCTREALIERCARHFSYPQSMLVWAPETERMVPAIELAFLHDAIRKRTRKTIHTNLVMATFAGFAYGIPVLLASDRRTGEYQFLLLLSIAVIPFVENSWLLRQMGRETPEQLSAQSIAARYGIWIGRQKKLIAWILVSLIAVIFLLQLVHGLQDSVVRAGLIKTGLHGRDIARVLTAPLMHANFMHILMNGFVLFVLAMVLEALLGGAAVALLFTASALGGSGLSLLFSSQTSVGASGGIMGLVGCLAVLGFRFHKILPPKFGRQMLYAVLLTALTGLTAPHVIDNAAHAGGLLTGTAIGLLLVRNGTTLPLRFPPFVHYLGYAALALILAAALFTASLLRPHF